MYMMECAIDVVTGVLPPINEYIPNLSEIESISHVWYWKRKLVLFPFLLLFWEVGHNFGIDRWENYKHSILQ